MTHSRLGSLTVALAALLLAPLAWGLEPAQAVKTDATTRITPTPKPFTASDALTPPPGRPAFKAVYGKPQPTVTPITPSPKAAPEITEPAPEEPTPAEEAAAAEETAPTDPAPTPTLKQCIAAIPKPDFTGLKGKARAAKAREAAKARRVAVNACREKAGLPPLPAKGSKGGKGGGKASDSESEASASGGTGGSGDSGSAAGAAE